MYICLHQKSFFYCVNTSYPMDNCFTGRRDRFRQTSEKDVLYIIPAGPARRVHSPGGASYFLFLYRHRDVIASFSFGAWRVKTCFQRQGTFGFIALIHPIQWTIAYPVGADRPAKRQKKTSCVSTGRSVRSTSALARWRVVLPSCLDSMTS